MVLPAIALFSSNAQGGLMTAQHQSSDYDAVILGAGAAGLMCALQAGRRGRKVLLIEHNKKPGAKILISGGGRCNFTNQDATAAAYISNNPHFAKSALSRYTPWDYIEMISAHGVTYHEKTLGQLFCDQGARRILDVLLEECRRAGVTLMTETKPTAVSYGGGGYEVTTNKGRFLAGKLVLATGGLSIPKMGASDFAFAVARQFGLSVNNPEPALVPFTFADRDLAFMKPLAGVAANCVVSIGKIRFPEALLFTHRGLSGPAILQISSYWQPGQAVTIDLLPSVDSAFDWLREARSQRPKVLLKTVLGEVLPTRLADAIADQWPGALGSFSNTMLQQIADRCSAWALVPSGTEGFAKAEVTRGGIATDELSSKTMESKRQPGLYCIGECVDVTGWLGGYNFQWAWASGWAAAQYI